MKKGTSIFIMIIILILFLMTAAGAAGTGDARAATTVEDVQKSQAEALETDKLENALPDEAGSLLGDMKITDSLDLSGGVKKLIEGVQKGIGDAVTGGLKSAAVIVIIAVLCSTVNAALEGGAKYAVLAGVLAISAVSVLNVNAFIGLGSKTLDDMNSFSKMLLPTLTGAAAASGAVTSAAAKYAATALFMDIMMSVSKSIVVPLIYAYTATSVAEAALGGEGLTGASNLLKWLTKTVMSGIVLLFVAYLSLTGVISGTTDAVTTKALKTTLSTVLPVVGSIIADASETVLAGASILRNAIGIFGFLAVAATCLFPFLHLGVNYLLYKAAAGVSGAVADGRITRLVNAAGTAFGMMLGLVGASALMLFISIISVIKVVT
ncbi:MAG: stage III sporulation protein AE [Clostridiales bacterium]|jgi:stage III sporulation protein AE|nr:stage III sporulation protein AE [Clostridiales bacterium]